MQRRRQLVLFDQVAGEAVGQHEGWLHGRDVELGAAEIRMGLDAAIGDGDRPAILEKQQFVRPDAMRRKFADARKAVPRVIDADHAGGILEIIFGRIKQRAVRREDAVTEEVAAGDALDGDRLAAAGGIEHHGKGSGLAREDDRAAGNRIEGYVMAAIRQVDCVQDLACFRQDRRAIGAVAPLEGGGEDGVGIEAFLPARRARARREKLRRRP